MREQQIIFFDGKCNLCDRFVNFVFKKDKKKQFLYAPLQGQTARQYLTKEDIEGLKSIVFLQKDQVLKSAPAIQAILKQIYPRQADFLSVLPSRFFNFFYKFIAKKRYYLFGKKDEMYQASEKQKAYFLPLIFLCLSVNIPAFETSITGLFNSQSSLKESPSKLRSARDSLKRI